MTSDDGFDFNCYHCNQSCNLCLFLIKSIAIKIWCVKINMLFYANDTTIMTTSSSGQNKHWKNLLMKEVITINLTISNYRKLLINLTISNYSKLLKLIYHNWYIKSLHFNHVHSIVDDCKKKKQFLGVFDQIIVLIEWSQEFY